jgi:probable phosphoglycerate mutase
MATLLLIRHGENEYTKTHRMAGHLPGIHLNARGREQALQLSESLKGMRINAIYSSPLERAIETAEPIARLQGLKIQPEPGLIETKVGKWQGKFLARLRLTREWKKVQITPSVFQFPGGESFQECQTRVITALNTILRGQKALDTIACVFHADPIKLAVAYYLGMPLDYFQRLACQTGSVTVINIREHTASLIKLNQRPPLDFNNPKAP